MRTARGSPPAGAKVKPSAAAKILYEATKLITGLQEPSVLYGFSNEFLWNYLLTGLLFTHLRGIIALSNVLPSVSGGVKASIRWLAHRSFALYLFHYPVLSCLTALSPFDRSSSAHQLSLTVLTLAVCYGLAEFTERRLPAWRKSIDHIGKVLTGPARSAPA